MRKNKDKGILKKITAVLTSAAIVSANLAYPELGEGFRKIISFIEANAESEYISTNMRIDSLAEFYEFSENYRNSPEVYQHANIVISFNTSVEIAPTKEIDGTTYTWYPIGTEESPFNGEVTLSIGYGSPQNIEVKVPLFDYITDSVEIVNIDEKPNDTQRQIVNLIRNDDIEQPLFANNVVHDAASGSSPATWHFGIGSYDANSGTTIGKGEYSGIIGNVGTGEDETEVNLELSLYSSADVVADDNAGIICGTIKDGSVVNVKFLDDSSGIVENVTSKNGNAGYFAGEMCEGSALNIIRNDVIDISSSDRTITGAIYAGSLVGKNDQGTVVFKNSVDGAEESYDALGTVNAEEGTAGGVFGYYKISGTYNRFSPQYYTSTAGCTLNGDISGGLVGELEAEGIDFSYSNASVVSSLSGNHTTYGGIIGSYSNTSLTNSLTIEGTSVEMKGDHAINYGGIAGSLGGDSALYVKIDDFSLESKGSVGDCTYFGGAVGSTGSNGNLLDIGDIKIKTTNSYKGGGLVGKLSAGVLRLSGKTDLSKANASSGGQLVGERNNALVYALGSGKDENVSYDSGWRFIRSKTDTAVDDIGTWGEVVRIADVEGAEGVSAIITYNSTAHTATVAAAVTDMFDERDFTKTALNMQLNDGSNIGALHFTSGSANTRTNLLKNKDLSIFGTISLEGTGITGFMRDGSISSDATEIKAFTGKLSKGSPEEGEEDEDAVVELAVGERYGVYVIEENGTDVEKDVSDSNSTGRGAVYKHRFSGLFARTSDGVEIENINIGGYMNIRANAADMYIGGAVAYLGNGGTLESVNVSETINYHSSGGAGQYVGGLIGSADFSAGKDINISGEDTDNRMTVSPVIKITGTCQNNPDVTVNQCAGGIIGYVRSKAESTITIEYVTLSANIDASGASAANNISAAGLISDIVWNGGTDSRTLVLNDIDVADTVIKNKATDTCGGILGYRWMSTDVTFDDVVLAEGESSNELNTPAKYLGGLVHKATGHWTVNEDGISIGSLAIKNGENTASPTSLGIIVHGGFYKSNDTYSGIYLEMMSPSSYYLADSGLTIPVMSAGYDELVYALSDSAGNILENNKAGVISYALDGVYSSAEGTKNSYNNVYNIDVVNNRSRYYYNADINSYESASSENEDGYKLLYWSLNRYAASNIERCFENPYPTDVLSGDYDLKNISYYPIDIGKDVTINNATFIFYNSEIEDAETEDNTMRSTRDGNSQHYLMHSGLFRNVTKNITTTGNITIYGSVGVDSEYSGALINGTLTGTLKTDSKKHIYLGKYDSEEEESFPLTISNTSRYLLINKIGSKAVLVLNGLYIGDSDTYDTSDDNVYASSLIGDVEGIGINLKFNDIKIDARNKEGITITKNKYGTTKSIFENATLLNKYDVDSTSVAVYNFSQSEDWKSGTVRYSRVTYGKELTDTVEYRDDTVTPSTSEENKYYEDGENGNFIDPETYPESGNSAYDFSDDFLPYVRYYNSSVSGAPAATYTLHEIKVNVVPSDLTNGCGTYDHPYEITAAKQLLAVANMLDAKSGYTPIPNINLPVDKTDKSHWCCTATTGNNNTASCKQFGYNSADDADRYESTNSTTTWSKDEVREYLASAYYRIGSDITLGASFTGLGAYDSTYSFKGVIVGLNDQITITNKSRVPFIKVSNGSVIKDLKITVDNYSATNAHVSVVNAGSNGTTFGYSDSNTKIYYGGVIGEIMGGDNIIDNISVTYSSNNTGFVMIPNSNSYLDCVGGYVGVIVNGGLIFRNMTSGSFVSKDTFKVNTNLSTAQKTNWAASNNDTASNSHLYINPYIGRVINGYAINETTGTTAKYSGDSAPVKDENDNNVYKYYSSDGTELTDVTDPENDERIANTVQQFTYDNTVNGVYTLDNGTKNYQIADVKADVTDAHKLWYDTFNSKNRVNIPDGQSLFILSLITQSGAGTATEANGDYAYGVAYDGTTKYNSTSAAEKTATHLAKYDAVGNVKFADKTNTSSDYYISKGDTIGSKTAVPYIIHHYTKADSNRRYPARMMTGKTEFMRLSTANSNYNLPESFRGIGAICHGMSEQATNNQYQAHIYGFEGNGATINENTTFKSYVNDNDNYANKIYGKNNINIGMGLFNVLIQKEKSDRSTYNLDTGYYIGNFNLTGNVTVKEYSSSGIEQKGGFNTNDGGKSSERNRYAVGGLAGGTLADGYTNLYNLDLNNFSVTGTSYVGGYIGRNNITEKDAPSGGGNNNIFVNGCDVTSATLTGSQGCCGGIVGGSMSGYPSIYVNTAALKTGDTLASGSDGCYKSSMKMSISNNGDCSQCGIGAVVGTIRNGYNVKLWVNNLVVEGLGTNAGFSNNSTDVKKSLTQGAGGLFGFVRKADSVIVTNCEIKNLSINAPLAGGLFGNIDFYDSFYEYGTSPVIKIANCKIKSDNASQYSIVGIKGAGGITGQFTSSKAYDKTVVGYDNNPYNYDVDGCEVANYTISQTGTTDIDCGSGGLFGFARASRATNNSWTKMRTIVNTSVHDCIIKADGTSAKHGMGAVIGCVPAKGNTSNYAGADAANNKSIAIDDEGTLRNTQGYCGDVGAYNISCYNNAFSYNGEDSSAKCGNFVGQSNGQVFKIVGFTRKNNTLNNDSYSNDFGGDVNADSYFIDADYMNISMTDNYGTAMSSIMAENIENVGEGAAKNYFPYVTVSPKIAVGSETILTGDGVGSYDTDTSSEIEAYAPVAKLITDEYSGTAANNRVKYSNVSATDINKVKEMITAGENTAEDSDIKLIMYSNEMGTPTGYTDKDFPVIAINGGKTNYNDYINAYIRTLTNTTDDYTKTSNKFKVDIYPCQCIEGVYCKVSGTQGFKLDSSRNYVMDDDHADSIAGNNQISMIDISFFDPTDDSKTAYHLYIPVLTKKLLKFNFSSAALQGTEYEPGVYEAKFPSEWGETSRLGATFDSWQTIYVRFDYTKSEIDEFLKTGKGLNWNTAKTIMFNYSSSKSFALSTEYVLLDNNCNADKQYYKKKSENDIKANQQGNKYDVINFADFEGFNAQKLKYIAENKIVYKTDSAGKYVECNEGDATVIAYDSSGNNKKFFKEGSTGTKYTLELKENEMISETYYLSMYTYSADNVVTPTTHDTYGLTVSCPMTFTSNIITCQRSNAKNTEMYLGKFLSQSLSITNINENPKISSDNYKINATLVSTVQFSGGSERYFNNELGNTMLYQCFYLYLNRFDINGEVEDDCSIKGMPVYTYSYTVGGTAGDMSYRGGVDNEAPYFYVEPIEILIPEYEFGKTWSSEQTVTIELDFGNNETKLNEEFPSRTKPVKDLRGIGLDAVSKLDFVSDRVQYSNNIKKALTPSKKYYIDRTGQNGIITLTALEQPEDDIYDPYGKQSKNRSALGINGLYIDSGSPENENLEHIDIGLDYDITNLPDEVLTDGEYFLNFTIVLEQKNNSDSYPGYVYNAVNIEDLEGNENTGYLSDFKFLDKNDAPLTLTSVRSGENEDGYLYYTYSMKLTKNKDLWNIKYTDTGGQKHFTSSISFDIKTDELLELIPDYKYANYKLKVNAKISKGATAYQNEDYIVYTNAKVNAEYVIDSN